VKDEELRPERLEERLKIETGERIDQQIALIEGYLDETKFLEVAMQTVGLRIHGDGIEGGEA
jgi:hypothetical protein